MLKLTRRESFEFAAKAGLAIWVGSNASGAHAAATGDVLRAGGKGSSFELLTQLFELYVKKVGPAPFEVIPDLGSAGGLRALNDGTINIAASGRDATEKEKAEGLTRVFAFRTPFVILTSMRNPPGLASADVARLHADPAPVWPDGRKLNLVLRPARDSDNALMGATFAGAEAAIAAARKRQDIHVGATDQENLEIAEGLAGSMASGSLSQVFLEGRRLVPVPLDGVSPSLATLKTGAYPYSRPLYFLTRGEPSPAIRKLAAFLQRDDIRAWLANNHMELVQD